MVRAGAAAPSGRDVPPCASASPPGLPLKRTWKRVWLPCCGSPRCAEQVSQTSLKPKEATTVASFLILFLFNAHENRTNHAAVTIGLGPLIILLAGDECDP